MSLRGDSRLTAFFCRGSWPANPVVRHLPEPRPKEAVDARRFTLPFILIITAAFCGCSKPAPKVVVPEVFRVKFETSQGDFIVEATERGRHVEWTASMNC